MVQVIMKDRRSTIDDYLWPNKYLLMIYGLWPMDHGKRNIVSQLFVYLRILLSVFAVSSMFVPQVLMIIVYWGDITVLTGVGCIATILGQLLFKIFYVLARRRTFLRIYLTTRELWLTTTNEVLERQGLEKLAGWAKRISIGYFVAGINNNINFTTVAIVVWIKHESEKNESLQERILPFDVWYGFDYQRTPIFEIAFGIQFVASVYCCIGIVGLDSTMMSLILHVCGHFRVIEAKLRAIGQRIQKDNAYSKQDRIGLVLTRKEIGRVIDDHRRILRIAEEMRNLLSPIICTQLLTSVLEISLSGYAVIAVDSSGSNVFKFTCYLLSMFTRLLLWCWPGQLLIQDSQALGDVVCYEMPWYLLPPDQQRDLRLFIMRTQKQCFITALKFQVMSISKFTEVVMRDGRATIDEYLWPNKYLLMIHGFWPMDPGKYNIVSQMFVYLRIVFSVIAVNSVFVPEILMIIVYWGNIAVLTGVGCVATTVGQLLFKMFYVLARRRTFLRMYLTTRELWLTTTNDVLERRGLEKVAGWAKQFTIGLFFMGFNNNINFTTAAIVVWVKQRTKENESLQERILPFDVWYGFDFQRTPNFEIAFGIQSIAAIYCCTGIVGFDSAMMSLILHVCGHFKVTGARLRAIGRRIHKDEAYSKPDDIGVVLAKKEIGRVIDHHCRLLRIAEEVRSLLSPIIFMQLLTSGLEICLSGYAVIAGGSGTNILKFMCYLLSMFAQLVVWCLPGQLLMQDSQALGNIVYYEMPWHLLPPSQQRDLRFFITRTQKQCQITALNFQAMSISKFTEVFNTAGSYFALLRRVYEKQMEEQ